MADVHDHDNHGKTPAAWAGSLIALLGSVIATVGVAFGPMLLTWVGLAVCVGGAIIGGIMSKAGKGSNARRANKQARSV